MDKGANLPSSHPGVSVPGAPVAFWDSPWQLVSMVSGPALADCPTLCVQLASVSQLITELLMKLLLTLALIWVQSWLWDGAIWSSDTRLRAFKVHGSRRTPGQTHLTEFWIFLDQLGRLQLMANWQKKSVKRVPLGIGDELTTHDSIDIPNIAWKTKGSWAYYRYLPSSKFHLDFYFAVWPQCNQSATF